MDFIKVQAVNVRWLPPNKDYRDVQMVFTEVLMGLEAVNVNNSEDNNNNLVNNGNANGIGTENPSSNNSTISSSGLCHQTLWNHVYNTARLQVDDPCKTVSGIIDTIKLESHMKTLQDFDLI
jgi:hypothetical protein